MEPYGIIDYSTAFAKETSRIGRLFTRTLVVLALLPRFTDGGDDIVGLECLDRRV